MIIGIEGMRRQGMAIDQRDWKNLFFSPRTDRPTNRRPFFLHLFFWQSNPILFYPFLLRSNASITGIDVLLVTLVCYGSALFFSALSLSLLFFFFFIKKF